ncbi:MAG: hypothetical protein R6U68_15880 [Desulfobacteraceae bacterium]
MKITDSEKIRSSEKEFIDFINAELDWEAIEKMLLEKHHFMLQEEVDYKNGDLVVYRDKIAYQLDFDVKVSLSVIFDRDGECLELSALGGADVEQEKKADQEKKETDESLPEKREDLSSMTSNLAEMISDINSGGE